MNDMIILAPAANKTELLRSLARCQKNILGLRIMNGAELAEYALMHKGASTSLKYVNKNEQCALIYSLLGDITQFSSASFVDAQNITATLDTVRSLITDSEKEKMPSVLRSGEFIESSSALADVYEKYMLHLISNGLIDRIQLMRLAIEKNAAVKAEIIVLNEFPVTPLENLLAESVSALKLRRSSLSELFGVAEKPVKYAEITEAYGEINEAENIISLIFDNKLPLDKCTIAVTDTAKYVQLFCDICSQYDIPVTFGCGLPITNSFPAQFLRNYQKWLTFGYCGVDALNDLIFSNCFNRSLLLETLGINKLSTLRELVFTAGNLRLSKDKITNKERIDNYGSAYPECTEMSLMLRKLTAELERSCSDFVRTYAYIREGECGIIDRSALKAITDSVDIFVRYTGNSPIELIPDILSQNIISMNSREGCLHICTLSQALSSMRENLFVAGLSANAFPGSPTENYLISDYDLLSLNADAPTSEKIISDRKKQLISLMKAAASLNAEVHLSYSGFIAADLKEENASSVLYAIYSECHNGLADMKSFLASIKHVGYFDSNIPTTRFIGRAYNNGEIIEKSRVPSVENEYVELTDVTVSPSAVETYVKCPRRFYYAYILKFDIREKDDVFTVISPVDLGNLIHQLMDYAAKEKPSPAAFYNEAVTAFDKYLAARPPINRSEAEKIKNDFIRMAETGRYFASLNESIGSEMEIGPTEIEGITLKGRLDSLEKDHEGNHIIVDYKTGRKIRHIENDAVSCLQVLLYAYMLKMSKGISVQTGEYRYLRNYKAIKCGFSDIIAGELDTMLSGLKSSLERCDFPASGDCKYCEYIDICRKETADNE